MIKKISLIWPALSPEKVQALRSGEFLTAQRRKIYSLIAILLMMAQLIFLVFSMDSNALVNGQPLGTDFSNVYAAGKMALEGHAADVWDWGLHFAEQDTVFGPDLDDYYGWHYPPFFLFIAASLAVFPYLGALFIWQSTTFAAYLAAMYRITMPVKAWLLPAIAFPAIYVNLTHGHNGFLSAALFGLGLFYLRPRPILAGIFIGLLAYKPHFGFLIPLALLAGQHYRPFFSASITVLVLCLTSTLVFGQDIWPAFFESTALTREIILEQGATGWFKIQSVFSAVMNISGSLTAAYSAQALLALLVSLTIWRAFQSRHADEDRYALLIIGALLFTPYLLDYDLIIGASALAFIARRGLRDGFYPWEVLAATLFWFAPILTRPLMMVTGIPLGLITLLILFVILAKPIWQARSKPNRYSLYTPA